MLFASLAGLGEHFCALWMPQQSTARGKQTLGKHICEQVSMTFGEPLVGARSHPTPHSPGVPQGLLTGVPLIWVLLQQVANKILG